MDQSGRLWGGGAVLGCIGLCKAEHFYQVMKHWHCKVVYCSQAYFVLMLGYVAFLASFQLSNMKHHIDCLLG